MAVMKSLKKQEALDRIATIPVVGDVVICNYKEPDGTIRRRLAQRVSHVAWNAEPNFCTWRSFNEAERYTWTDSRVESWEKIDLNAK